jgi:hypothetical protein
MSQKSKLIESRIKWKCKSTQRADENRYLRKELNRVKKERDQLKAKLKGTQACQSQTQSRGLVILNKADLVFLALQLFLVAHIGFRAISRVLGVLADVLGIKAPCPQTIINWVSRLSLVRIQSASMLKGLPLQLAPVCNGMIWMIDTSIALGTGKILTVLALNAHHHQLCPEAPGFENVHCIAVSVADTWTGESIAAFLKRIIDVTGRPAAYLKDGGRDLQKAIRLLDQQEIASPSIDDISHLVANLLKHRYHNHPLFETFLSACGHVSGKLKQTILACLAPPKVQTKARFMNVHRLITWADRLLDLSPRGSAAKGSILMKLRTCLDKLPSCRAFIKQFRADAAPLLECQTILKTNGLSHDTLANCEPFIQSIASSGVRRDFRSYLQDQLLTATALGLDKIGLPISSDQIESLFGLAKQHGTGQIKDADRIAIRLPALCGVLTQADAQQVIGISVSEQNKLTGGFNSLIKQRRQILPNPECLESLAEENAQSHITLIPGAKNRSKNQLIEYNSMVYPIECVPDLQRQSG